MLCPSCSSEYDEGIVHCDECGVDLVERLPEDEAPGVRELLFGEPPPPDAPADRVEVHLPGDPRGHAMRRVHVARTLADAHIVKDALEGAGFACVVHGEHLVGIQGEVPIDADTLPSVWVPESQAERAIRLVADTQGGPSDESEWTCPECGEEIEGQFTDCWQCGAARP